jgi:hypothetical protein
MGEVRGKYKPKEENIRKLFAFLRKEEQTNEESKKQNKWQTQ